MSDLAQFLRDRYAEQRTIAMAASPWPWKINPGDPEEVLAADGILVANTFALSSQQTRATAAHIAANDPQAVLADLDAKLALVDDLLAQPHDANHEDAWYSCATITDGGAACLDERRAGGACDCGRDASVHRRLMILARAFAGHPGHKGEEWTP